jgi:hypothetical protein
MRPAYVVPVMKLRWLSLGSGQRRRKCYAGNCKIRQQLSSIHSFLLGYGFAGNHQSASYANNFNFICNKHTARPASTVREYAGTSMGMNTRTLK